MSHVEDLKAAALAMAQEADRSVASLWAVRELLSRQQAAAAQTFEGTSQQDVIDALVRVGDVYTKLEELVGELGLSIEALRAYAERI